MQLAGNKLLHILRPLCTPFPLPASQRSNLVSQTFIHAQRAGNPGISITYPSFTASCLHSTISSILLPCLPPNPHTLCSSPTVRLNRVHAPYDAPLPILRNYPSSRGPIIRCAYLLDVCSMFALPYSLFSMPTANTQDNLNEKATSPRPAKSNGNNDRCCTDIVRTKVSCSEAYEYPSTTSTPRPGSWESTSISSRYPEPLT